MDLGSIICYYVVRNRLAAVLLNGEEMSCITNCFQQPFLQRCEGAGRTMHINEIKSNFSATTLNPKNAAWLTRSLIECTVIPTVSCTLNINRFKRNEFSFENNEWLKGS